MKRSSPDEAMPTQSLAVKKATAKTYYIDDIDDYSVNDRMISYKPTDLNQNITKFAPSIRFLKCFDATADFEINPEVCVFVRRIDHYMKYPGEVFKLSELLKAKGKTDGKGYLLCFFILILNNQAINGTVVEELSSRCVFSDLSLLICSNCMEAASYITGIKAYEKRGSKIIQKHTASDLVSQVTNVLTSIESVNKDNAIMLMSKYKTMSDIMNADLSDLTEIPGMGNYRVLSLFKAFQQDNDKL